MRELSKDELIAVTAYITYWEMIADYCDAFGDKDLFESAMMLFLTKSKIEIPDEKKFGELVQEAFDEEFEPDEDLLSGIDFPDIEETIDEAGDL